MRRLCAVLALACVASVCVVFAQERPGWVIEPLNDKGWVEFSFETGLAVGTNGVLVSYGPALLTADSVQVNRATGEVIADGRVRIQHDDQVWAGEHIKYNFVTRILETEQFRTGKSPVFAAGEGLHVEATNDYYSATNAYVTVDDSSNPLLKVRAKSIRLLPGNKIEARNAVLYVGKVPVFYFPYYSRKLDEGKDHFNFVPGYRGAWGPFLLSSYTWFLSDELDTTFHVDYRVERGFGLGPDFNYNLGKWGAGSLKYYYLHDWDPHADSKPGADIPDNRQRVWFSYLADPYTNLSVRSMVRYQGDTNLVREFFEGEYRQNPQPSTFVEANKYWQNFSLDTYVQPRVNDYLETVERLPDVRLTGYLQQLGQSPFYYESESSAGYYRRLFAEEGVLSPGTNYSAGRADTYHQITLPQTLFGWLNLTPRVGGRFTYYSEGSGPGATTQEQTRGVFNTGAEASLKASRLWPGIHNDFLDMDGLRHVMQPSMNYVYVPSPNVQPYELPQFDTELPSLRLLPNEFPDYNSIDSVDSQNVMRFGLRNKFQTKREGKVVNLADWDLYTDWRLRTRSDQTTFSDIYSDLVFRPRSWLSLESMLRYDINGDDFRLSFHSISIHPNSTWSWSVGHFYIADDYSGSPTQLGDGYNLLTSTIFTRFSENWGMRFYHRFNLSDGRMEEQAYTLYRDLRSWTAGLTLRLRDRQNESDDVTVAFTFSLKAFPRFPVGHDAVRPYSLWGG